MDTIIDNYFYSDKLPKENDLVFCRVSNVSTVGITCDLMEYNNLNGFLPLTEISKKNKYRPALKTIKLGNEYVLQVTKIDPLNGCIDLSKKYVTDIEKQECEDHFIKAKRINLLIRQLSLNHNISVLELNKLILDPFKESNKNMYDFFMDVVNKNIDLLTDETTQMFLENVNPEIRSDLFSLINNNHGPFVVKYTKLQIEFRFVAYSENGVDDLRLVARNALAKIESSDNIRINTDTNGYVIVCQTKNVEMQKARLLQILDEMSFNIKLLGGALVITPDTLN